MRRRHGLGLVLLAGAARFLAACSAAPPPPPAPPAPPVLDLTVKGSAEQNPNPGGAGMPVAVHLYQLSATQAFELADVFALIEHEKATLGSDVLSSSEFVLVPSETKTIKQDLKAGTTALGVLVLFQNIDQAQWRAAAPVAANGPTKLVLMVDKLSLSLRPAGK